MFWRSMIIQLDQTPDIIKFDSHINFRVAIHLQVLVTWVLRSGRVSPGNKWKNIIEATKELKLQTKQSFHRNASGTPPTHYFNLIILADHHCKTRWITFMSTMSFGKSERQVLFRSHKNLVKNLYLERCILGHWRPIKLQLIPYIK